MLEVKSWARRWQMSRAKKTWLNAIAQGATDVIEARENLIQEFVQILGVDRLQVQEILNGEWGEQWKKDHYTQDDVTKLYQTEHAFPLKNAAFSLTDGLILERLEAINVLLKEKCVHVLDYACGAGSTSLAMKEKGIPHVYSGDISEIILDIVRKRLELRGYPALTINLFGPCHRQFDAVVAFDLFDVIADHEETLNQLWTLIRPGGLIITNLRNAPTKRRTFRLGGRPQEVLNSFKKRGLILEKEKCVPNNLFAYFRRPHADS